MIYANAADLFRMKFNKQDLVTLFRDLRSRDVNPEIWDKQIKFWTSMIVKWGDQYDVVDFSASQLEQAFEYDDYIPHIQPSIDVLTKSKVIVPHDTFVKKKSLFRSFTSKIFGFANSSNQQNDIYIFANNLKHLAKKIISDIKLQEAFSTDVVLTNEEVKKQYCQDIDFDLLRTMLERTSNVKTYSNGFYFQTDRYPALPNDLVNAILNSKLILSSIDKRKKEIEKEIKNILAKAIQFKKQNLVNQSKNCLRRKRLLESQEDNMEKMHFDLSNILSQLAQNELSKSAVDSINQIHMNCKKMQLPDVQDIENMMDEFNDVVAQSAEISNALGSYGNQIDDSEIEAELQELMNYDTGKPDPIKTKGNFQYQPVISNPLFS